MPCPVAPSAAVPPAPLDVDVEAAEVAAARGAARSRHEGRAPPMPGRRPAVDRQTSALLQGHGWPRRSRAGVHPLRALEARPRPDCGQGGRELGAAEQAARAAIAPAVPRDGTPLLWRSERRATCGGAAAFRGLRVLCATSSDHARPRHALHERLRAASRPARRASRPDEMSCRRGPDRWCGARRHVLVGRASDLGVLADCWRDAVPGARRLVLVTARGDGKTSWPRDRARAARNGRVLSAARRGRAGALQPVVVMGAAVVRRPLEPLRRLRARAAELGWFGELGPPPLARRARGDPDGGCGCSTRSPRCSTRGRPLPAVPCSDLHWPTADAPAPAPPRPRPAPAPHAAARHVPRGRALLRHPLGSWPRLRRGAR